MIVHFMGYGMTPCMMPTPPAKWPDGHRWVGRDDIAQVNCEDCLAGLHYAATTFTLDLNGPSITCKRCGLTSFNGNDVKQHYCPRCHAFHDDIWPPARKWWIEHPDKPSLPARSPEAH